MTLDDMPAGLRLCRASHWNQVENDWRCFLEFEGGGGHVAEREGVVVGSVAYLRYGSPFTWLSMMLVDPRQRGAGVGTQLLECALDELAGEACVRLDATPAGEPLYRRHGFVDEYTLCRMKGTVAAGPADRLPAAVRPMTPDDLAEVCAFDRAVFGAGRGALLESVFRRAPQHAWAARDGSTLLGYTFGRPGYLADHLGPVVAESEEVARGLVSSLLAARTGQLLSIDVPQLHSGWIGWLESLGLTVERPFLRMMRGQPGFVELPAKQFAITGPEFG